MCFRVSSQVEDVAFGCVTVRRAVCSGPAGLSLSMGGWAYLALASKLNPLGFIALQPEEAGVFMYVYLEVYSKKHSHMFRLM